MDCTHPEAHDGGYFASGAWGLIVYRLTYNDQALWDDYLQYIHKGVRASIDWRVSEELWEDPDLGSPPPQEKVERLRAEAEDEKNTFHLCLREGPKLDGCSIDDVRNIHSNWLLSLSPQTPPGSYTTQLGHWHTHTFSLTIVVCVDDDILQRFMEIRTAKMSEAACEAELSPSYHDDVAVKMVWTGYDIYKSFGWKYGPEEDEEDCDSHKIWQYFHVYRLPSFCNAIATGNSVWFDGFARPPGLNRLRFLD
jgi:hypothetical protein